MMKVHVVFFWHCDFDHLQDIYSSKGHEWNDDHDDDDENYDDNHDGHIDLEGPF